MQNGKSQAQWRRAKGLASDKYEKTLMSPGVKSAEIKLKRSLINFWPNMYISVILQTMTLANFWWRGGGRRGVANNRACVSGEHFWAAGKSLWGNLKIFYSTITMTKYFLSFLL